MKNKTSECAAFLDFVSKRRIANHSWQPISKSARKDNINEDAIIEMLAAKLLNKGTHQTPIVFKNGCAQRNSLKVRERAWNNNNNNQIIGPQIEQREQQRVTQGSY